MGGVVSLLHRNTVGVFYNPNQMDRRIFEELVVGCKKVTQKKVFPMKKIWHNCNKLTNLSESIQTNELWKKYFLYINIFYQVE